jgi:voltage-gated potassium channel
LFPVLAIGVLGYMSIEGWGFLDALYMTVITITTVGYREVQEVSPSGRVFTIFIIFLGMGIFAYTLGMVAQLMVEFQVRSILGRRKLGMKIKSLKNHYVICGYGRIGSVISQELLEHRIPQLVIDSNPAVKGNLESREIPYIIDDASNDDVLIEAGVERATGLVATLPSDADNTFIVMSGRGLNPGLFILARAELEKSNKKLMRAGANRVVMPHLIGGLKMAHFIVKPAVSEFVELTLQNREMELQLREMVVGEKSAFNGVTLVESRIRQELNVIVVAMNRKDGTTVFNPSSITRIEAGDTLIALGQGQDLDRLSGMVSGR